MSFYILVTFVVFLVCYMKYTLQLTQSQICKFLRCARWDQCILFSVVFTHLSPSHHGSVWLLPVTRVGNFGQKNYSAEYGIDGTNGYFRRNSGCSAEQKTSEFRSAEEKTTRNSVMWKNTSKLSEFHSTEEKPLGIPFRGSKNRSVPEEKTNRRKRGY